MRYYSVVWLFFLLANNAHANLIEVPVLGHYLGFGSSMVYQGQTFTTPSSPSPIFAKKLTVFVGSATIFYGADFRVLLTEVDSTIFGIHPTKVLFESSTLHVPSVPITQPLDAVVIDLGGLRLDANREYAFILDHFVVANNNERVIMTTGVGTNYDEGHGFLFLHWAAFPEGTRQDHFASNYWLITAFDFAFTLAFTPTPTPVSMPWLLLLMNQ